MAAQAPTETPSTATSACRSLSVIRGAAVLQLNKLNQRFDSARRCANLIAGFARNTALPIIPNIPGIAALDLRAYEHIAAACPQLGLAGIDDSDIRRLPGIAQIEALRQAYQSAVQNFIGAQEATALGMIDKLQSRANGLIDRGLQAIGPVEKILQCACAGVDEISNPENVETAKRAWTEMSQKPTLVGDEFSDKLHTFKETQATLKEAITL